MSLKKSATSTAARLGTAGVAVLLAVSAPGCQRDRASGSGLVTIGVMLPPSERPFWLPIAERFEAENPGVRVELVEGPQSTDLRENLYTAALLAEEPSFDLVYLDVTWTSKFAAAGWLLPLEAPFDSSVTADFLPAALEAGRFRGSLYRIPVRTDIGLLLYREDLLEAAGIAPPETFEQLVEAATRLQSPPGVWGFVWQGKQYEGLVCAFLEVLHGHGGFWIDPATLDVGLDRAEAVSALKFLVQCRESHGISPPGVTTYQEEESRRLFQDGRAIFLRNWPYARRLAEAEGSPLQGRVGSTLMVHEPGALPAATLGGWGLGVSRFSRHPELSMTFIRAATSLEGQRDLCRETGYAPARRSAYDDAELLAVNPFLTDILRWHEFAVARPTIARYALASDILQRRLTAALTGAESTDGALRAAARETRLLLARSGDSPDRESGRR
jgi:multiple sugar transport system substrate-binding protein